MSKKHSHHYTHGLPNNISQWQTNFTQMKHKVIDYLKKHTQQQHPIIDAQHYLILSSSQHKVTETPILSCVKINRNDHQHLHEEIRAPFERYAQQQIHQNLQKHQKTSIFKAKCKVSSTPQCSHSSHQHQFPPVCSLQLEKQQKKQMDRPREVTLQEKLGLSTKITVKDELNFTHRKRYKSIDHHQSNLPERRVRANSTFKRIIGEYQKVKLNHEAQNSNIFSIPISQFIRKPHEPIQEPLRSSRLNPTPEQSSAKEESVLILRSQPIKQVNCDNLLVNNLVNIEDNTLTESCGNNQPRKQLHNTTHKRFYAHTRQHKQEIAKLQKQGQKFVVSPWQALREEATITNLDKEAGDS